MSLPLHGLERNYVPVNYLEGNSLRTVGYKAFLTCYAHPMLVKCSLFNGKLRDLLLWLRFIPMRKML
jgi:hypothetical protein